MSSLKIVFKSAQQWSQYIILKLRRPNRKLKVSETLFQKYMILGHIMGELAALRRFLVVIRKDESMYNDNLEAELQLSIVDYHNYLVKELNLGKEINIEDVLKGFDYYSKNE